MGIFDYQKSKLKIEKNNFQIVIISLNMLILKISRNVEKKEKMLTH